MRTRAQVLFATEFDGDMFARPPGMSDRNYAIAIAHLVSEKSLEAISWDYGLTRERIRQIVENGLRRALETRAYPDGQPRARTGLLAPVERTSPTANAGRGLRAISLVS